MQSHRQLHEQATAASFQCSQCSKTYKRPEHLQRHAAVHKPTREYQCLRCSATFQRSDVLSRHARTCDGKQTRRTSLVRRACDACMRSKRKCSFSPPCLSCTRRGITCTFSSTLKEGERVTEGQANDVSFPLMPSAEAAGEFNSFSLIDDGLWSLLCNQSLDELMADNFNWPPAVAERKHEERSLRFLESFTRNTGFLDSFDCLTAADRTAAHVAFTSRPDILDLVADELQLKFLEIITYIQEAIEVKPRNSPIILVWSAELKKVCMDFFSPRNIRLWLDLYWAIWHPNVNFMHRPTFDASTCKASLLAAMCIIGALVSPDAAEQNRGRFWMNSVEEMVFRDDDVCYDQRCHSFPSFGRLQALQAMYMVCLFQNWEGDDSSKSRVRRFRYSTMVANARDIGIHHARHPPYHILQASSFSWHAFVAREELIRVLMWIFLLDTAFVIFNNVPPRMSVKEMKMSLASCEASFQAPNAQQCYRYLQSSRITVSNLLSSLTAAMCKGPIDPEEQEALADIGSLNLFALTSALHAVIFQTQQAFGLETQLDPVRNALDNWSMIWQFYSTTCAQDPKHNPLLNVDLDPDNMWQRIGFMRFASEYWLLAKLIVDRITNSSQQQAEPASEIDGYAAPEDGGDGSTPTILNKYDETSMRQVNDLITEFQRVAL